MANQVVVSPLLELVSDKLANLIENEFGVGWGVQNQIKKLSRSLYTILDVLSDAEEKQVSSLAIRNWLKELKDVAYAVDDVLEDWEYEDPEMSNNNFVTKLTDSLKELDDIANESHQFHLQNGVVEKSVQTFPGRETGSLLTEQVYGREEDKRKLVRRMLGPGQSPYSHPRGERSLNKKVNSLGSISVCAILAIGGLGKTTLAKLVYNDEQVAKHFDERSWICVSDDFDIKRIMRGIISSLTGTACAIEELDPLQRCLQDKLRGKRFLLVLDDVWQESQHEWNELKGTLAYGAEGSCVIVTTRLKTVATIAGTLPCYHLKPLSQDDCWSLFKQYAFGLEEKERPDLMETGKKIVMKCKGVPLAAKALGALMRFKRDARQWLIVEASEIWELPDNGILPALRLSYHHLPSHLRQCFGYCSIFPKDHEINRKHLIHLWMANGFVQSKGRMEELEDVGNKIFDELLCRSFFQDITKDEDGNIKKCKMHDLVHDLARDVAGDECTIVDGGRPKVISRRTRHVSLYSYSPFEFEFKFRPCLRSLIVLRVGGISTKECEFIFSHLLRLRALDLSIASVEVLPDSIGNMKQLRYLNLSENPIRSLPESICKLRNIETLNLAWCINLETLPKDTREMCSLRYLNIKGCSRLTKMPIGMGKLTNLRTLSFFIVGLESGCGINEMRGLNNIGGELKLKGLQNVTNLMDANEANLVNKENLSSLWLIWSRSLHSSQFPDSSTEVMGGLQPHHNLRLFSVYGYPGVNFPSWLAVQLFPKLVEIRLSNCRRCENLPPLKRLPSLKVLKMYKINFVKFIDEDDQVYVEAGAVSVGGFRSLEELEMKSMPYLEGWSRSFLSSQAAEVAAEAAKLLFPCLKILTLRDCPKLKGVPLPSSIECVRLWMCHNSVLGSLQNLPRLSFLQIEQFGDLECFPRGMLLNLTALQTLSISGCSNVRALPVELRNLSSLTSLTIVNCNSLKSLPELEGSHLVHLEIRCCAELEYMEEDFKQLVVLEKLILESLPKMTCFPEGIKQAIKLKELFIQGCSKEVMELPDWISTLTSLESLCFEGCKNRKVLPEGMQNLTALGRLIIVGSDAELARRCERNTGEDWSKIAHISLSSVTTAAWSDLHLQTSGFDRSLQRLFGWS